MRQTSHFIIIIHHDLNENRFQKSSESIKRCNKSRSQLKPGFERTPTERPVPVQTPETPCYHSRRGPGIFSHSAPHFLSVSLSFEDFVPAAGMFDKLPSGKPIPEMPMRRRQTKKYGGQNNQPFFHPRISLRQRCPVSSATAKRTLFNEVRLLARAMIGRWMRGCHI